MPYRRRHGLSRLEKLIIWCAAAGFSVVAGGVVLFLIFGEQIFGTTHAVTTAPIAPNTIAPAGRPPPPVIRQAPPMRPPALGQAPPTPAPAPAPSGTQQPPRPPWQQGQPGQAQAPQRQ
jgi:hypothetical protein